MHHPVFFYIFLFVLALFFFRNCMSLRDATAQKENQLKGTSIMIDVKFSE